MLLQIRALKQGLLLNYSSETGFGRNKLRVVLLDELLLEIRTFLENKTKKPGRTSLFWEIEAQGVAPSRSHVTKSLSNIKIPILFHFSKV